MTGEQFLQDARNAHKAGNEKLEADSLKEAAQTGYAPALAELGKAYREGSVVEAEPGKAFELTKEAAEQGYVPAMTDLADMYMRGLGVQKSTAEAAKWSSKASAAGVANAPH